MITSSILRESNFQICLAEIPDHQDASDTVQEYQFVHSDNYAKIGLNSITIPGLHIQKINLEAKQKCSLEFHTDTPHVLFLFYLKGLAKVVHQYQGRKWENDHDSVKLKRSYLDAHSGVVYFGESESAEFFAVRLTIPFYKAIVQNDPAVSDDEFHKNIVNQKFTKPDEYIDSVSWNMLNALEIMCSERNVHDRAHYLSLKLTELLFLVHQHTRSGNEHSTMHSQDYWMLKEVQSFLLVNYQKPLTIPELAKRFYVGEKKLKSEFKKAFGCNIYQYVLNVRMQRAKELIGSGYTVAEIAHFCGYQSISHFIKVFKKYYGVTPKEMMKNFSLY